jgi:hypothetical protein
MMYSSDYSSSVPSSSHHHTSNNHLARVQAQLAQHHHNNQRNFSNLFNPNNNSHPVHNSNSSSVHPSTAALVPTQALLPCNAINLNNSSTTNEYSTRVSDAISYPTELKKERRLKSSEQLRTLKEFYSHCNRATKEQVKELQLVTGLTHREITRWFRNERHKEKKSKEAALANAAMYRMNNFLSLSNMLNNNLFGLSSASSPSADLLFNPAAVAAAQAAAAAAAAHVQFNPLVNPTNNPFSNLTHQPFNRAALSALLSNNPSNNFNLMANNAIKLGNNVNNSNNNNPLYSNSSVFSSSNHSTAVNPSLNQAIQLKSAFTSNIFVDKPVHAIKPKAVQSVIIPPKKLLEVPLLHPNQQVKDKDGNIIAANSDKNNIPEDPKKDRASSLPPNLIGLQAKFGQLHSNLINSPGSIPLETFLPISNPSSNNKMNRPRASSRPGSPLL